MAAFGTGAGRPLSGRGGSPGFRFTLYALLSVIAMYLDQRAHYLEQVRYVLQAAAYPLQLAVNSPPAAWRWLRESMQTREALEAENTRLHAHLNRGAVNGVFNGQAVLDDKGLIGQTTHVGPWSAEVILITDAEHAVPVLVARTGLRTIAVGAGDTTSLALPYLPGNADIKSGDLLVSSGLGGVFPEGYPVARVTEVHRDAVQPLAQVRAAPLAHVDTDSEVMLVWFRPDHPAAPAPAAETGGDLRHGNPALQPQATAPKGHAAPQAAPAPPPPPRSEPSQPLPTQATAAVKGTPALPASAPASAAPAPPRPTPGPASVQAAPNVPATGAALPGQEQP